MGILFAFTSAVSWGCGDFCGGIASRRISQFQVLILASFSSLALLLLLMVLRSETVPSIENILKSLVAGVSGAVGLPALYRGLSFGNAALVAPAAGVIGAIIPMIVGGILEGFPGYSQIGGFILGLLGIWVVSSGNGAVSAERLRSLGIAILAGIGFGGFLTLIAQIDGNQVIFPLVVAKAASATFAGVLLWGKQQPFPSIWDHPVAILSGFLDSGGNLFYLRLPNTLA